MPEHRITQKAGRASTESLGTTGDEPGDQARPETRRAGQPAGRFKTICRRVAVLALDILEHME